MQHQHHIPPESSVTSRFVGITHQLYIACNEWIKHSTVPSLLFLILSLSCMCMLQISVNSRREDTVPCPTHGWVNSSYLCDVLMATLALVICAVTSSMTFVSVSTLTWNNHQTKTDQEVVHVLIDSFKSKQQCFLQVFTFILVVYHTKSNKGNSMKWNVSLASNTTLGLLLATSYQRTFVIGICTFSCADPTQIIIYVHKEEFNSWGHVPVDQC